MPQIITIVIIVIIESYCIIIVIYHQPTTGSRWVNFSVFIQCKLAHENWQKNACPFDGCKLNGIRMLRSIMDRRELKREHIIRRIICVCGIDQNGTLHSIPFAFAILFAAQSATLSRNAAVSMKFNGIDSEPSTQSNRCCPYALFTDTYLNNSISSLAP